MPSLARKAFYTLRPRNAAGHAEAQLKIGGDFMARTPTSDILTDDVIYKNRREQPPDAGV